MLCPLGDLLAEGSVESAQAMAAAALSSRQHSSSSSDCEGGGGGSGGVHFHFPEPQTYPRESGEKPGEKSPPVSRTGKGRQPNQETERRVWEVENGQFSSISAVCGRVGASLLAAARGEGWLRCHPSQFLPSADSPCPSLSSAAPLHKAASAKTQEIGVSTESQTTRVLVYKMPTINRKPTLLSRPLKGLRDLAPASPAIHVAGAH